MASTALDALIAEMLGDIGKIHDSVNELSEQLPAMTEQTGAALAGLAQQTEAKLTVLVGQLVKAGETVRANIERHAQTAEAASAAKLNADARQLVAEVVAQVGAKIGTTASQAVTQALGEEVQRVAGRVSTAADRLTAASEAQRASLWSHIGSVAIAAFVAALLGAGVALYGSTLFKAEQDLTPEQIRLMRNGQALANAWDKLDQQTQNKIKQAYPR